jgi:hypothetical protein
MADWPDRSLVVTPLISAWSEESYGGAIREILTAAPASGAIAAAIAYLVPFRIAVPRLAQKMWTFNGATATGNIEIGIYLLDPTGVCPLLVKAGPTAQSGTSAVQEFDITDTWLLPGDYYAAVASSSASTTLFRASVADEIAMSLLLTTATATSGTLPTTLTPAANATATVLLPVFGVAFTTLVV